MTKPPQKSDVNVRTNPTILSPEQIKFYNENGYLIVPCVFSDEACERIKQEAEPMADGREYHALLNIHRNSEFFLRIMRDPVLVSLVETLQKHKVVGLNDQYFFKRAGTPYAKQAWNPHQDITYVGSSYGSYIQLHIFLVQSDSANGGLYYYSGSHKEDILPYEYRKSWREEFDENGISHPGWLIKGLPSQYEKIDITGPKGGICFQHGNIIHGSHPNLSKERSREQYSLAYLNEGATYMRGQTSIKIPLSLQS